ncbi:MAG: tRNA (adenosine(37)-N6)-threonylcarbamoyltransferase complex dimerization subunit type 1 TsaB [Candidatus Omnitrophica bacterium]|nr:tRNA (adenosine(37)-N6)-threonylcarbamoyltransferase complex dimerization subunit type 1 TsaB [Candidatus Omnitrophota bacterium]
MKILAVDTSTRHLSVAVTDGDKLLAARNVAPRKDLSMTITFDIERALQKAGIFLHDIEGFVVGLGPGSFTGLRVGLSMMKAFIMVTEKPVVGVSSLDAIAMNVRSRKPVNICVINDARRGLLYACVYEKKNGCLTRKCEYLLQPVDEVLRQVEGETVFIGDGIPHARDVIVAASHKPGAGFVPHFELDRHWLPKAKELARLGYQRLLRGDFDKIETLAPLYLYPEDCQVSSGPGSRERKPAA